MGLITILLAIVVLVLLIGADNFLTGLGYIVTTIVFVLSVFLGWLVMQ